MILRVEEIGSRGAVLSVRTTSVGQQATDPQIARAAMNLYGFPDSSKRDYVSHREGMLVYPKGRPTSLRISFTEESHESQD